MTETGGTSRRPGFRGVRNTDTTAATAARLAKAKARKIEAARALLTAEGHLIISPAQQGEIRQNEEDAWHLREVVNALTCLPAAKS